MLDNRIRQIIDPTIDRIANIISRYGVSANAVTYGGFVVGLGAATLIVFKFYILALILILISRLADGLDGAIARINGKTDIGGFLDIVLDFAFYGLIPAAFVLADPENNSIAGIVLLFSFYINGASFLTFALMAEKRGLDDESRGPKSILYNVGLAEATETIVTFLLFCLFPTWFSVIAYVFAAVCLYTAVVRVRLATLIFT